MEKITRTEYNKDIEQWITKDYIEKNNKKRFYKKKFKKCFNELFEVYFYLSGSEPKVLSYLILNCNKFNQIKISYNELSSKLRISKDRIKQIMQKLKQLNVINSNNGVITINPFMYIKNGNIESDLQNEYMPMFNKELQ